ncbi:MAG: bifunctional methylenetetrahydrofolate dehydrogenase/methenyltetrahydrofolate cyclohydrolase FolD [Candidatus Zixiibacteriota bacterium]|nr:MAG: bifunctional methylenetetrahydrofolate dehydrogenase/methenyltetrahydrofolate cyclohydrolase FolD [candidate division Zixibacteria bacterium]
MPGEIIDGKKISTEIKEGLKQRIEELKAKGSTPGLAAVLVGDNPASEVYVKMKAKACEKVGILSEVHRYQQELPESELLSKIDQLNREETIHGILVQFPTPEQISEEKVILAIDPTKDVDGFHPFNVGMMLAGKPTFMPCTPLGIVELLMRSGNDPSGKHVVILGRGSLVGRPLAPMLYQKAKGGNATVTVCHTRTHDLPSVTRQADILVAAMGKAKFVTADMVKPGVVVIDVGTNRIEDPSTKSGYRLVGDVDFDSVSQVAKAITPVPGGVGPMTIAMLLSNTVRSCEMLSTDRSTD